MPKRLVLFDIDETMISSDGAGRRAIQRTLDGLFQVPLEAMSIPMSGKTDPQILIEILELSGMKRDEILALVESILESYLINLEEEIPRSSYYIMHEGVEELIARLKEESDMYLGLLTGNIERGARMKLNRFNLNHHFPIGAYGSDSASRLDLPAVAKMRADQHYRLEFDQEEIVIIGDAVNDILCARHYGAVSVAVNTGRTSWQELEGEKPDYLFQSLKDTEKVLAAIQAGKRTSSVST